MRVIALAAGLFFLPVSASSGGSAATDAGGHGRVTSVSCAAPGDCAAGGYYRRGQYNEAFVVSETNGKWGKALAAANRSYFLDQYGPAGKPGKGNVLNVARCHVHPDSPQCPVRG